MFKSRILALIFAVLVVVLAIAPDAEAKKRNRGGKRAPVSVARGVKDPRYADIILNPVTGEIYHSQAAQERRYPASLTKMMTLYLLFEALEQHKVDLDSRLPISDYAATMPQTNLALSPGDTITVETAIKALVVRSANDVAVVVGEALGGDVDQFAVMMTSRARKLGMKNTVFRNPNGLPNPGQYTTAHDMAKLGIALKRDFPKYYKYFSTLQFSHNGVTYYTHNRVMLRYAGVDGIKTGFIGLSGFNLVTSVTRGGRPLVGAVMGGGTGAWRDNRMIQLLDQSYAVVAKRGAARGKMYPINLPVAKNGGIQSVGLDPASISTTDDQQLASAQQIPENAENEDGGASVEEKLVEATIPQDLADVRADSKPATPFEAAEQQAVQVIAKAKQATAELPAKPLKLAAVAAPAAKTKTNAPTKSMMIEVKQAAVEPAAGKPHDETMVVANAPAKPVAATPVELAKPPVPANGSWGIQVGAFSTHELADQAARAAQQTAAKPLTGAKIAVAGPGETGAAVHRARLENLSQSDAKTACELLISANSPCFIYKVVP